MSTLLKDLPAGGAPGALRQLTFARAVNEALDLCLEKDPAVYVIGLGAPDPKGIFGTTLGLQGKYGDARVMDMATSENGMTGIAIGSALAGMRPIMTHQRIDFALLSMDQIVNQAAKWHYMFGGRMSVPLVIRLVVGRGWGQGPQHSQSLQSWFAHVPGLKVVMPTTPADAKGLLISSVEDDNPVIYIEHRWLHGIAGNVPEGVYRTPLGRARLAREGTDVTVVALSYMTLEALRAAEALSEEGISVEVVDVRSLRPLDDETILRSVDKTRRLVVADTAWKMAGFGSEIVALVAESGIPLAHRPYRIALPDAPTPTSPALAAGYYPRAVEIISAAGQMFGLNVVATLARLPAPKHLDVPDASFSGPF